MRGRRRRRPRREVGANERACAKPPGRDCAPRRRGKGDRDDNAKQTQFRRGGRAVASPAFHYSIIPPFQFEADHANKANLHPPRGIGGASRDPKRGLSRLVARSTLQVGAIAPNKPNSGRPGGGPATPGEGRMCETKPIWPGRPGMGAGGWETPTGSDCAKQSQFPPEQREGQVPSRKGVMVNRTCNRLQQNKANLQPPTGIGGGKPHPTSGRNYAKQTQFKPAGRQAGDPGRVKCAKQSQFPGGAGRGEAPGAWDEGQILQNEPNFRELVAGPKTHHSTIPVRCQSCKTNPMCRP